MRRRTFLLGSAGGLGVLFLSACFPSKTTPTPTTTPTTPATPPPSAAPVPQPAGMVRSNWGKDPFARGSASFTAVGGTTQSRIDLAAPVGDRLFFAGEATSSDQPGTLRGAADSGARAAQEVLAVAGDSERIAVIGGGVAGLAAATALRDAGHTVRIVEARDRLGGRVQSDAPQGWPIPVELGPWMLRDGDGFLPVLELDADAFVPFDRTDEIRTSDGETVPLSRAGSEAVTTAVHWSARQPHDVTLAAALSGSGAEDDLSTTPDANGVAESDWLEFDLTTSVETRTGARPDRLSAWNGGAAQTGDDLGTEIPDARNDAIFGTSPEDIDLVTGAVVTRVVVASKRASLRISTGESVTADRVIVTVPLGVLKSDTITFEPDLPLPKKRAISILDSGTVDRIWLRFDEPFWTTTASVWSTVATDSPVAHWVNLREQTGESVLVGTVAADAATRLGELDDAALVAEILPTLIPFADPAAPGAIPVTASPTPTPTTPSTSLPSPTLEQIPPTPDQG